MMEAQITKRPAGPDRITLGEAEESAYWVMTLEATESALRDAIAAVGSDPEAVRHYISTRLSDY